MDLGDSTSKCACAKNTNKRNLGFDTELFHSPKHVRGLSFFYFNSSQCYAKLAAKINSMT